jgi:RNA-directed DNA polymerase
MRDAEAEAYASMASPEGGGRNLPWAGAGAESRTAAVGLPKPEALRLMEAVVERSNLFRAYERVVKNEGAPGVDGLSVLEFKPWLQRHWVRVRQDLLMGVYQPEAVRKVEIPKPQGGVRTLGIPTVLDRLIQQALNQVLQPLFDPEFSVSSYGFRPGRNAGPLRTGLRPQGGRRIKPSKRRKATLRQGSGGSSISTWRSSSIV